MGESSHRLRHRRTLSSTLVDESVAAAAALVEKWHPDLQAASLFLHPDADDEPQRFLRAAADLHRAMLFFAHDATTSAGGHGLVEAQALLQTAMRRLDLELQLLLQQQLGLGKGNIIRAVADAMMAAGYGKECVSTFKSRRRAALAAELQSLLCGLSPSSAGDQFHKLSWDQLEDAGVIPTWVAAAPVAFDSLFGAEKDLCDAVFDAPVAEAVFAAVAADQAASLVGVAEAAVARARRAPERLFRVLDVHDALTESLPELLSVFGESSEVAGRAALVVAKVGEATRGALASLEAAIHKEPTKATAAGGAVHPLTRYVMNYLVFLADYQQGLAALLACDDDGESYSSPGAIVTTIIQERLVRALLGKLEAKAGSYKEVALSYLFLANNTQYVANKVAGSGRLRGILGEGWAEEQAAKARAHVDVYVRAAWGKVTAAMASSMTLTTPGGGEAAGVEQAVMAAVGMQDQWVAADEDTAHALRAAATAAVVPKYRMFYRRYGAAVKLTPGDVAAMIAALFTGPASKSNKDGDHTRL
ncbi:hypothetical protein HU200_045604 [Digitaria exilis]|uniref:Exocyst subunit Exo70 family protein n=1 Tax=Digitaria exilis TaxID=1010633 RepID=A0A835AZP7_9POAL|nr:hypothetical protein HU200_045604 [Digitaria exilis]CAB3459023.1 unnamed protein product [Digitaria exilis]